MNAVQEQMVEQQVRAWHVLNEGVLNVLRAVPREQFVPASQQFLAFADAEVPLAQGQHMLRPSVVGRLLQALAAKPDDRALEVGAGSGYVTACLARLCRKVRSVEIFPDLAELARTNLRALNVGNAEIATADLREVSPTDRYDVIAITASLPIYDSALQEHLKIGGRLFVVVGEAPVMDARLVRRVSEREWTQESLFETVVDPLIHARHSGQFLF